MNMPPNLPTPAGSPRAADLDEVNLYVDAGTFKLISDWLDAAPTDDEASGMNWLIAARAPWRRD